MSYVGQDEIVQSIWDNVQRTSLWCWEILQVQYFSDKRQNDI